jgi:hypothetical protein
MVLGQRALGAESATASALAAIKIVTRTECHCTHPKGTTREREDPVRSPRQQAAFISELAPKKGIQSSARSALTCPLEDLDGDSHCHLPIPVMNFVPIQLPRGCGPPCSSPFWNGSRSCDTNTPLPHSRDELAVTPFGTRSHCADRSTRLILEARRTNRTQGLAPVIPFPSSTATR